MNSFAIWYDTKEENSTKDDSSKESKKKDNDKVEANINFNLWKLDDAYRIVELSIFKKVPLIKNLLCKRNLKYIDKCKYFLDIGMKINDIKKIKTIYIYTIYNKKRELRGPW